MSCRVDRGNGSLGSVGLVPARSPYPARDREADDQTGQHRRHPQHSHSIPLRTARYNLRADSIWMWSWAVVSVALQECDAATHAHCDRVAALAMELGRVI